MSKRKSQLADIYKAKDCTDINDVEIALYNVNDYIARNERDGKPTAALYQRKISLLNRKKQFT